MDQLWTMNWWEKYSELHRLVAYDSYDRGELSIQPWSPSAPGPFFSTPDARGPKAKPSEVGLAAQLNLIMAVMA